jgi:trk system potassium uptake protein TrkA
MKKKTFLVLGLDNFGYSLAKELYKNGQEVIVVDMDEKRISEIRDEVSEAVVADATDRDTIEELGLDKVDAAVVSLGETRIGPSVLATLHLKEMGIENIIVKAVSSEHGRIVEKIGATKVVFPEFEIAQRLASKLSVSHVFEEVDFPEGYSLIEILAPKKLQGKTLIEAQIRTNYGITVVWIKRTTEDGKVISILPNPDDKVYKDDVLFVLGLHEDIEKFKKLEV